MLKTTVILPHDEYPNLLLATHDEQKLELCFAPTRSK